MTTLAIIIQPESATNFVVIAEINGVTTDLSVEALEEMDARHPFDGLTIDDDDFEGSVPAAFDAAHALADGFADRAFGMV